MVALNNSNWQPERSLLAMPPDLSVKFGATKIHRVIMNRKANIKREHSEAFPVADKALVIGAGVSMSIFFDFFIDFDKYDLIILTHPMVEHYRKLVPLDKTWIVDCEYQPISTHYYDKYAKDVQLICRLGKEITTEYKRLAYILPEGRDWNIHENGELVPELPYSTGAMGLWYALHKFGGKTEVDYVGIDNDGVVSRYWQETRDVLKSGKGRCKNLAIYMKEFPMDERMEKAILSTPTDDELRGD